MADSSTEKPLTQASKLLQSVAKPLVGLLTFLIPLVVQTSRQAYAVYKSLPTNAIEFLAGFVFCFFGGLYPTLFAAVQAAEHGGRKTVVESVGALAEEALTIIEESKKDDKEDKDKDGKADVEQISNSEYVLRKTKLVFKKMNPEKVDKAIASLYRVWLAVLAVLTLQFARTISLALSISDFLKMPIDRFIAPTLSLAIPEEYKKWVPTLLGWIAKSIAMSIAWYLQTIISAFSSALIGGLMMARALYHVLVKRGYVSGSHEETSVDEILSYVFAAAGFYFQFKLAFDVPFPFNLLLWPLEFAEWRIRWTLTKVS